MTALEMLRNKEKEKVDNNLIKIDNNFIEGFLIKNSTNVIKVLFYLALDSNIVSVDKQFTELKINIKNMLKYIGIDRKTLISQLESFQKTSIKIVDSKEKLISVSLLPRYSIEYTSNEIFFFLDNEIKEKIIEVKNNYTVIDAQNIMKLKFKHSLKMIQFLEKYKGYSDNIPKRGHFILEELNLLFGVNYKTYGAFENKILKKIKSELDEISNISFVYQVKKDLMGKGRPKSVGVVIDLIRR